MQIIEKQRLSDIVADRIRRHIVDNNLQPGDRLPTEHDFADSLGVSRLAVREATRALGFIGVVDASPRRGLTVGTVDFQQMTPFLQFHPAIRNASPIQLIDTRIILETGGLPLVMQKMKDDPQVTATLFQAAEDFANAKELSAIIQMDIAFHRCLLEASGLSPLVAFGDLLTAFFQRFREGIRKPEWKAGIRTHFQILEALQQGRLSTACSLLRDHIESHRHRIESGAIRVAASHRSGETS